MNVSVTRNRFFAFLVFSVLALSNNSVSSQTVEVPDSKITISSETSIEKSTESSLQGWKALPKGFNLTDFLASVLTVFVTVILIIGIRVFGNLPTSIFGADLNLTTYRFLWDTALKAAKQEVYWPRYDQSALGVLDAVNIEKNFVFIVLILFIFLLLGFNLKLSNQLEIENSAIKSYLLKFFILLFGIFSLFIFLGASSVWG